MNQKVKNKNNSSNSLVFGRWPQTKMSPRRQAQAGAHSFSGLEWPQNIFAILHENKTCRNRHQSFGFLSLILIVPQFLSAVTFTLENDLKHVQALALA